MIKPKTISGILPKPKNARTQAPLARNRTNFFQYKDIFPFLDNRMKEIQYDIFLAMENARNKTITFFEKRRPAKTSGSVICQSIP